VEEETGIKLNIEDMVDLTALLDPATGGRMLPSPVTGQNFYSPGYDLPPRWCFQLWCRKQFITVPANLD
jgi:hypothetical protein